MVVARASRPVARCPLVCHAISGQQQSSWHERAVQYPIPLIPDVQVLYALGRGGVTPDIGADFAFHSEQTGFRDQTKFRKELRIYDASGLSEPAAMIEVYFVKRG